MNGKNISLIFASLILLYQCKESDQFVSTGTFDAEEWLVPAEGQGKVITLNITEGSFYEKGEVVGYLDTTLLSIKREQICSQIDALKISIPNIEIQLNVLKEKKTIQEKELERINFLVEKGSASIEMANAINDEISVTNLEISALNSTLNTSKQSILAKAQSLEVELKFVEEQINNCIIVNPESGIVLAKYVKEHEFITIGAPLYKIANVNLMYFTAWITGDYLSQISIGDSVSVSIDIPNFKVDILDGVILSIAEKPQFTPSNVQTKENRIKQHYKVRILVQNSGKIKSGMPGEVIFPFD